MNSGHQNLEPSVLPLEPPQRTIFQTSLSQVLKKFSDTSSEETEKKEKEVGRRFRDSEEESEALEAANSFSRIDQRMDKKLESKDEENSTHSGACTIKLFTSEGKQLSRNYKWGFKNTVSLRRYCNCCKAKFLII